MSRGSKLYLDDILNAIKKISSYTKSLSFDQFTEDEKTVDAVVRNLEVLGEAVKNIPETLKSKYGEVEWKKIAGVRDIMIHEYFGVDTEILWDIVQNKLPILSERIQKILKDQNLN